MSPRSTGAMAPEVDDEFAEERRSFALDLDTEFVYYLGKPSAWQTLKGVDPEVLIADSIEANPDSGELPRWSDASSWEIFEWQKRHYEQHGVTASAMDLESHFGIRMCEPEIHVDELVDRLQERRARNMFKDLVRTHVHALKTIGDGRILIHNLARDSQAASAQFLRQDGCVFSMEDVEDEPQEFLLDSYLPLGVFTLLQGQGGVGKSILGIWLIQQVEGNVLIVGDEDTKETVKRRLREAGVNLARIRMWDLERHPLSFPSGEQQFETMIKAHDIRFVILDTATEVLDAKLKGTEADDVLKVIMALRRVAARTSTAILGIGHTNRNESGESYKRIGGSIAWYNRSKSALLLGEDPNEENTVHLFHEKHNYSPEGESLEFARRARDDADVYLELTGESELEFHEVFNARSKKPTKTEQTAEFFDEWASQLPVKLEVLRADFNERYADFDISERVLDRGRKTRGWDSQQIGATYWVGTPASFRGWTPPGESEPLSAAERIKGRRG